MDQHLSRLAFAVLLSLAASAQADSTGTAQADAQTISTILLNEARTEYSTADNAMVGAFAGAEGINQIVQNNGSNNSVQSATSVAVNKAAHIKDPQAKANEGAIAGQDLFVDSNSATVLGGSASNAIGAGSFKDASGINQAMQNNGNNNAVAATAAVAVNKAATAEGQATADARYESFTNILFNQADETGGARSNNLSGDAFAGAKGLNQVVQNNGNNNAIGVSASVAVNKGGSLSGADAFSESFIDQTFVDGNTATVADGIYDNTIGHGAFAGATGINQVTQNNGSNNAIGSAASVAINGPRSSSGSASASANAQGFSENLNNTFTDSNSRMSNELSGHAFAGTEGINQVTQNNGSNNAIHSSTAVALNKGGAFDDTQAVALSALVAGTTFNRSSVTGSTYGNRVGDGAFAGSSGVNQVVQNNGSNNVIGTSIGVAVNN